MNRSILEHNNARYIQIFPQEIDTYKQHVLLLYDNTYYVGIVDYLQDLIPINISEVIINTDTNSILVITEDTWKSDYHSVMSSICKSYSIAPSLGDNNEWILCITLYL